VGIVQWWTFSVVTAVILDDGINCVPDSANDGGEEEKAEEETNHSFKLPSG